MIEIARYKHFKGNVYDVLHIGINSETLEKVVVYKSITDGVVWVRPLNMFEEEVLVNGKKVKRFEKLA